jgi:hypothetical protein
MSTTSATGAAAASASPAAQPPFGPERWQQFWDHWKAEPQQVEGIELLRQAVIAADPAILQVALR